MAGGIISNPVPIGELFDPSTGAWTATSEMVTPRIGQAIRSFPTAQFSSPAVTCIRSRPTRGDPLPSIEVFDPSTEEWTETAPLADGRDSHMAVLLPSGEVMVLGGFQLKGGAFCSGMSSSTL